mmetsp:Transcript_25429/g.35496  ORF Transcript_25429/g.35496 Transcript_25429/m.35496 type:complete len:127 (+) Transcript_25429:760-1140(+)
MDMSINPRAIETTETTGTGNDRAAERALAAKLEAGAEVVVAAAMVGAVGIRVAEVVSVRGDDGEVARGEVARRVAVAARGGERHARVADKWSWRVSLLYHKYAGSLSLQAVIVAAARVFHLHTAAE